MRRDIGDVGIVWSSGNSGERAVHRPISTRESQEIFTFTRVQSNARICNIFAIQAVTNRNHFHRQTKMPYLEETMEQEIILEARNITKVYPGGVVANHNVNLQIKKGEIHALVGENGAGKSTLMKMLFGMLAPTEGQIFVDGKEVHFSSSSDAIAAGLGMVHQHFMQVPSMTVAENLILGAETGTAFKVDRKEAVRITTELSDKYNLKVEAKEKVEDISLAMRQKLEILKALYRGAHILILDEPTAVLTPQETEELFEQLKLLRENGHTIIFISHKLNEVKALCNRMTILRDGKTMGTYEISDLDEQEISRLMVGRDVSLDIEKEEMEFGKDRILRERSCLRGPVRKDETGPCFLLYQRRPDLRNRRNRRKRSVGARGGHRRDLKAAAGNHHNEWKGHFQCSGARASGGRNLPRFRGPYEIRHSSEAFPGGQRDLQGLLYR